MARRSLSVAPVRKAARLAISLRAVLVVSVLPACRERATQTVAPSDVPVASSSPSASASHQPSALPPLRAESWLVTLPVDPKHYALASLPLGATEPRPVVLGVQGAGDRPEWACGGYRGALDAHPFIVCPAGEPAGGGKLTTSPPAELARLAERALDSLRARFDRYVAPGPLVYVGFSLGAIHAPALLASRGKTYPRVLLVEGGYREFTPELARRYAESGGERVLLVCAAKSCRGVFDPTERALEGAGIRTKVVGAATHRHNLDGEMVQVIRREWPWLVEGLLGWQHQGH